jgi:tetratricopeptide (TPR) repeat protein
VGRVRALAAIARIARHQRAWQLDERSADGARPARLGDFRILDELGRGSMGVVYEAQQISLNRRVALKVLPPGLGFETEAIERFRREARAAARLQHPNIVPVYSVGQHEGSHFFAMEFIDGISLREAIAQGRFPQEDRDPRKQAGRAWWRLLRPFSTRRGHGCFEMAARLMAGVADALEHAHSRGVFHRDVKPANLLLCPEQRLRLTDFGVARVLEDPAMTHGGAFIGTPAYMAPERILGASSRIDGRADIFSAGAVLYELLTGRRAFEGDRREAVVQQILTQDPVAPSRIVRRMPADLETICLKALEKDPNRRYQRAADLAADLRAFLGHETVSARRAGPLRRTGKFIRRHPSRTVAAAAVCVVALLGAFAWRGWELQKHESARRALTQARLAHARGEYGAASTFADEALAGAPELAEARVAKARAALMLHDAAVARMQADALLGRDPHDWRGHLILVMLERRRGQEAIWGNEAIAKHLAIVAQKAPETADAFYLRALAARSDAAAIELLDRTLALDPAHADALLERALRHAASVNFDGCLQDCERLIVARPRSPEGHILKGRVFLESLKDVSAAAREAERALAIDPGSAQAYALRGSVRETMRRFDEALADYRKAIALQPQDSRILAKLVRGLRRSGRSEEALTTVRDAVAQAPQDLALYWSWYRAAVAAKDLADVGVIADRLVDLVPRARSDGERAKILMTAAHMAWKHGQNDRAFDLATRAIDLDPLRYGAYTIRADVRRSRGDPAGARAECERVVDLELESPLALRDLETQVMHYCHAPDLEDTLTRKLVDRFPQWPEAWHYRALALLHMGNLEGSVSAFRRAVEIAPEWAATWAQLGETLSFRLHRHEQAIDALTRAIELAPWQNDDPKENAYLHRAWARFSTGDLEGCLIDVRRTLRHTGPWRGPLFVLAIALYVSGRCDEGQQALEDYSGAPGQGTNSTALPYFEAVTKQFFCAHTVNLQKALELTRNGLARSESNASQLAVHGMVEYRLGRLDEAVSSLEEATSAQTLWDIENQFFLAMAHHRLGHEDEAARAHQRGIRLLEDRGERRRPDLVLLRREAEHQLTSHDTIP